MDSASDTTKKIAVPLTSEDDMEFGHSERTLSSSEEVKGLLNEGKIENDNVVNGILGELGE